jgi:type II restriction/modification system DNA methylase subunit YeeA
MLHFEINRETGDAILTLDNGDVTTIDQQDRDYLADQLKYARQDEGVTVNPDIYETKEALKSKLALYELHQYQEYWCNKWFNMNARSMREYVNFHTSYRVRDAAIKSGLEIDDLLLL